MAGKKRYLEVRYKGEETGEWSEWSEQKELTDSLSWLNDQAGTSISTIEDFVGDETAINSVLDEGVEDTIHDESHLYKPFAKSEMAATKLAVKLAGEDHVSYDSVEELAADETAMDAVTASETAMDALAASETAMDALAASEAAMDALAASETAMDAVTASETAMDALAASETAMDAIWSSELASEKIWEAGDPSDIPKEYEFGGDTYTLTRELVDGRYALRLEGGGDGSDYEEVTSYWEIELDLSVADTLKIKTRADALEWSSSEMRLFISGDEVWSTDSTHEFTERTIDISDYSSRHTISFGGKMAGLYGTDDHYWSDFRLE